MQKKLLLDEIVRHLTHLSVSVSLYSRLNLQDINVIAENFFRDFLNLALGYQLANINIVAPNATAIDLGDATNRIAIQVTSTTDFTKVRNTHSKFVNAKLEQQYDRLVVLMIGTKRDYKGKRQAYPV